MGSKKMVMNGLRTVLVVCLAGVLCACQGTGPGFSLKPPKLGSLSLMANTKVKVSGTEGASFRLRVDGGPTILTAVSNTEAPVYSTSKKIDGFQIVKENREDALEVLFERGKTSVGFSLPEGTESVVVRIDGDSVSWQVDEAAEESADSSAG